MSAYFVTGTGTDVGKTFVTCTLLNARTGARGFKPIISGAPSDAEEIIKASGKGTLDEIALWRFAAPLSPHRAAALENAVIDTNALESWCREKSAGEGLTLIEGAGGVMTPITERYTMRDLAVALKLPVILVTGSYLGSISHTLSAIESLESRGVSIKALVLSESTGSAVTLAEAEAGLMPLLAHIPLRIVQPRVSSWKDAQAIRALAEKL